MMTKSLYILENKLNMDSMGYKINEKFMLTEN